MHMNYMNYFEYSYTSMFLFYFTYNITHKNILRGGICN